MGIRIPDRARIQRCAGEFRVILAVAAGFLTGLLSASISVAADTADLEDFNDSVRPILSENCYACHGPDAAKRKAGLRLDERESAVRPLESGRAAIVPGAPEKSRLLELVTTGHDDERMPPVRTGKRLAPSEIATLRRWIEQGAPWSGHWAYVTPERPAVPPVNNAAWPRNPIDSFVLERLEDEARQPAPEADQATLIRRVTMDLTGLPPALEEVDAFLADDAPDAYDRLVDRLLASQHYGERMAQDWLDLARYADSDGYHADHPRSMWQYRDWVIDAFNGNQPFDRFTLEQIAGDLLPDPTLAQRVATAFNRNGMSSTEGGADPDEYLNKYVTDRVNATSTVWLGTSMACAECHDHKYDPFTQKEYYQLYDFFNRIPERGLDSDPAPPFVKVPSEQQQLDLDRLSAETDRLQTEFESQLHEDNPTLARAQAEWEERLIRGISKSPAWTAGNWSAIGPFTAATGPEAFATVFPPETNVDLAATLDEGRLAWQERPDWKDGAVHTLTGTNAATYLHRVFTTPTTTAATAAPIDVTLHFGSDDGIRAWLNGTEILNRDVTRGVAPNQDKVTVKLNPGDNRLLVKVVNHGGAYGFYFSTREGAGDERLDKIKTILAGPRSERGEEQLKEIRTYYRENHVPPIRALRERLTAKRKERDGLLANIPTIRVMDDTEPRPTHIRVRGDYRNKGEIVTADVPAALPPLPDGTEVDRLALARWLVHPAHPLVGRVTVNRFWRQYFGIGLVKTSNEFGSQGERPSHPALLDWLAREFVDGGWDVKALQRLIVTSATYRQRSDADPGQYASDPENRLLARGPRFRLPAETVRDAALAYAGLLDANRAVGGPSVRPFQPPGLWEEMMFGGNKYMVGDRDERFRRSLYTLWKRTVPYPMFKTFDAPDRAVCTVQRGMTCTPLQAFVTLNEQTFIEAARVLAQRVLREPGPDADDAERLTFAFRTVLAREPDRDERDILARIHREMRQTFQADSDAAHDLVQVGFTRPPEALDKSELAAWTAVANVLLNLDETITKE